MTDGGPSAPASGAPSSSARGRNGARLPTSMRLLGVAVRAFDVVKQRPANCVLRTETMRRGLSGERCTERWCCPLTAFVEHLLDNGLVALPDSATPGIDARSAIYMPLATEMIWWERLRESGSDAGTLAHFRLFVAGAAHRLGGLLGAHSKQLPGFVTSGAWATPERRAEPLRIMFALAGKPPLKLAQKGIGYDEDTLASWVKHGQKPSAPAIDALAGYFAKRIEVLPAADVHMWLTWHYAMAHAGDALADAVGREAVVEAAGVFARLSTCVAASVKMGIAAGQLTPTTALAFFLRSAQSSPPLDLVLDNLARHGASDAFLADVSAADRAWARAVPAREGAAGDIDLFLFLRHAPRLPRGKRRRRRREARKTTAR